MQVLKTDTLHLFRNGLLAELLDASLFRVHADCQDRPALKKKRTVTLEMAFEPTGDDTLETAIVTFQVKHAIPAQKVAREMKALNQQHGFGFEVDTDAIGHHPDQMAFDDEDVA